MVSDSLAEDKSKLNLIVHINTTRPDDRSLSREDDGGRRLKEEERLLGLCAVKFGNVVPVERVSINVQTSLWGTCAHIRIVASNANDLGGLLEGSHGCQSSPECETHVCGWCFLIAWLYRAL